MNLEYQPYYTLDDIEKIKDSSYDFSNKGEPFFDNKKHPLKGRSSERFCWDRLEMMLNATEVINKSVLDLGCSVGFFAHGFAFAGAAQCIGVDNNLHTEKQKFTTKNTISAAKELTKKYKLDNVDIVNADFTEWLRKQGSFDIIIFLSVFHHFCQSMGYANSGINALGDKAIDVLRLIDDHCGEIMFFEVNHNSHPMLDSKNIKQTLLTNTSFKSIDLLGWSDGFEGKRGIYKCQK